MMTNICKMNILFSYMEKKVSAIVLEGYIQADSNRINVKTVWQKHCHCYLQTSKRLFYITRIRDRYSHLYYMIDL